MTKKIRWKIILVGSIAVLLFLPQTTLFAADKSHIGDPCINEVTNADCKIGGADLDCEISQKKDATNNYLKYCDCAAPSDCEAEYGKPANGTWECSDGSAYTYDLDYCYNTVTKLFKPALTELNKSASVPSKLIDAVFDSPATQAALLQEVKTFKPGLEIRLPGLTFSDLANTVDEEGYLHIPWIGEFIKALYNFGLVIISIVAVVMIIMQGAKIVVSGGESKVEGYKKIGQVAVGLVIAWGSYAILYTINPALVEFKSLKIKYIERIELPNGSDAEVVAGSPTGDYTQTEVSSGDNFIPCKEKTECCKIAAAARTGLQINNYLTRIPFLAGKIYVNLYISQWIEQIDKEIKAKGGSGYEYGGYNFFIKEYTINGKKEKGAAPFGQIWRPLKIDRTLNSGLYTEYFKKCMEKYFSNVDFCQNHVIKPTDLSNHSFGFALDINSLGNPNCGNANNKERCQKEGKNGIISDIPNWVVQILEKNHMRQVKADPMHFEWDGVCISGWEKINIK